MLTVLAFKWADPVLEKDKRYRYTAEHVNVLRSMLARHLRHPHRMVCVTDNPDGLDAGIDVVDMPTRYLELGPYYPKLWAFSREAAGFGDRLLLIDLDTVIVDDLVPLVARREPFVAWETTKHYCPDRKARFNTSMVLMDAGAFTHVWERFDPETSPDELNEAGFEQGDQGWVSYVLGNEGAVWPRSGGGVESFASLNGSLPDNARVVFFNGRRCPHQYRGIPWVKEHWH